ncbi:MAG: hypothetical protein WKH64_07110 [Chloroflexia bacterium]
MLGAVVVQQREMVFQGLAPITGDAVRFFYPLLELMGNTLRSGVLPGWNPHQMAGAPLMGDPQSGWGAVVPMLAYTFLPLADATAVNLVSLTSVSAVGMLLFLRSTGVSVGGATLGSLSYALGTFPYKFQYNPTYIGMIVWLPWLLLGADLALRHRGRTRRRAGCFAVRRLPGDRFVVRPGFLLRLYRDGGLRGVYDADRSTRLWAFSATAAARLRAPQRRADRLRGCALGVGSCSTGGVLAELYPPQRLFRH